MVKLSRVDGSQRTKAPPKSHAPREADDGANESVREGAAGRCSIWPAIGLALLAFASAEVRAQQAPALGDIYESGGEPAYTDKAESNCEKSNTSIYKGMNPLVCYGVPGSTDNSGKCSNTGPTMTLWKQQGRLCIYCQHINPPLTNGFVVPFDDLKATESQGFTCGVNQTDPACTVVCYGPGGSGKFRPPSGTSLQTPPPAVQKKPIQDIFGGPVDTSPPPPTPCAKPNPNGPKFTPFLVSMLNRDVASAKAMVAKAKTYTDKNPWDAGTQAISTKYFGSATPATQQLIRQDVNNVLKLLNGIKSVTDVLFPAGADPIPFSADNKNYAAYVHQGAAMEIYLYSAFFQAPETGPDSQPAILVHELSHLPQGANTEDLAYGQTNCRDLVYETSNPVGQSLWAPWYKMPDTGAYAGNPLANADSFRYFVYDVANQK
jgi:hypothetical protein